jgi:hypothetical protein
VKLININLEKEVEEERKKQDKEGKARSIFHDPTNWY